MSRRVRAWPPADHRFGSFGATLAALADMSAWTVVSVKNDWATVSKVRPLAVVAAAWRPERLMLSIVPLA